MSLNDFQIFVKPVGAECNLNCLYCYYLDKSRLFSGFPLMDDEILEKYITSHFEACKDPVVNFSWHGGEPLLSGLGFFRRVLALQEKYRPERVIVRNGIQTNGTLIDEEWARFLSENNFFVGISIDGPEQLHNRFRVGREESPSFSMVMNGYRILTKQGINPEILCVVSSENVRQPLKVYNFFRRLGAKFITFLPLVEKMPGIPGQVTSRSVRARDFGIFLSRIFDQWVQNGIGEIKIQIFEEAARVAFGQDHTLCIFRKTCGGVPVLERNGNLYSCDHYVDEDHLIGNVMRSSLKQMLNSARQREFGQAKLDTLPRYCIYCPVRDMCNGECPKNRFISTPDGEPGLNYLCEGYRHFFNHCQPFVEAIGQVFRNQ